MVYMKVGDAQYDVDFCVFRTWWMVFGHNSQYNPRINDVPGTQNITNKV
jgi:hypothetical protein